MTDFTRNYNFNLPDFDIAPWHELVNDNFDQIDALLFAITGIANFVGAWSNSTNYTEGQRVFDDDDGLIWQCNVDHTSSASSSFASDRLANPTYWTVITSFPFIRGEWGNEVVYVAGDVAFDPSEGLWGFAKVNHISTASPATMRNDIANWDIVCDFGEIFTEIDETLITAVEEAEGYADAALQAANSLNLPLIQSGDEGKALLVKTDLSGYEHSIIDLSGVPDSIFDFPELPEDFDGDDGKLLGVAGGEIVTTANILLSHIADNLITFAKLSSTVFADAAAFRAKTANKILLAATPWDAADIVTLSDASTITVNMSTFINAQVTLAGNRTLGNPTNTKVGQCGVLIIKASGATRTLALGGNWKPGQLVEAFPISITTGQNVAIAYWVESSSIIWIMSVTRRST